MASDVLLCVNSLIQSENSSSAIFNFCVKTFCITKLKLKEIYHTHSIRNIKKQIMRTNHGLQYTSRFLISDYGYQEYCEISL